MSTFTKEQLIEEVNYNLEHCFCSEKTKRLMEIALASLKAEGLGQRPVGLFAKRNGTWLELCQGDTFEHPDGVPLYTAPLAPESVPDGVLKSLLPDAEKSEFWFEHDGKILFEGVKFNNAVFDACRAATLQEVK